MADSRVLVAGATGQLGRVITRKLLDSGVKVRALARNAGALAAFAPRAEIAAVDMRDVPKLTEACRGVDQIVATANNNMGTGGEQPDAHRSRRLPEPVRRGAQHRRAPADLRLVSRRRAGRAGRYLPRQVVHRGRHPPQRRPVGDAPADGVHGHLDRPDPGEGHPRERRGDDLRRRHGVANYIAVEDVAEFAVKILARPEIVNEAIDVGGPSNVSQNDLAAIVERRFKSRGNGGTSRSPRCACCRRSSGRSTSSPRG